MQGDAEDTFCNEPVREGKGLHIMLHVYGLYIIYVHSSTLVFSVPVLSIKG